MTDLLVIFNPFSNYLQNRHDKINKIVPKEIFSAPQDRDLRINYCDDSYKCITFKIWKKMTNEDRKKYIDWVRNLEVDHYEYSLKTHDGIFLKEIFGDKFDFNL